MDEREIGKGSAPGAESSAGPGPADGARPSGTDRRTGPSWRGWVISILVAVILSVAATVLFGGPFSWRVPAAAPAGPCGGPCCPPAQR